ncbi:hypothetical protein BST61_g6081 [Cercospora zeina]
MPLFTPVKVKRTTVNAQNPICYDNMPASEIFAPGQEYLGRQTLPPDNKWSNGTRSFMAPIPHYHLLQIETFYVESGSGIWYAHGKEIPLSAGQTITIPRFTAHTFANAPGSTKPLVVLYKFDEQMYDMERRFFANTLTYLDDCRLHSVEPSILQLCIFLSDAWMPPNIVPVPRMFGEWTGCFVNACFMWICAFIGRALYGYKGSYEEYYTGGDVSGSVYEGKKNA